MTARPKVTFDIPPNATTSACRSCGKPIAWIVTSSGKKMPVELDTRESHFANCHDAGKWRKR